MAMYLDLRWWTVVLIMLASCGDDSGVRHPPDAPHADDAEIDAVPDAEIDAPVIAAVANDDTAAMLEDGPPIVISPLANDTAGTAGTVVIASFTQPTHGTLVRTGDTFTYTPLADFFDTDAFTYELEGGDTATVAIAVGEVNDAPSFTKGADQTVLQSSGMKTVMFWATAISAGPSEEQTLEFTVTPDNAALFAVQPTIAENGTLTFMPAAGAHGTTTVTVVLHDDGGTENGGVDTAAAQTFVILIKAPA